MSKKSPTASSPAASGGARGGCGGSSRGRRELVRIAGTAAILLAAIALTNLAYHVIPKPTELFAFVGTRQGAG